MMQIKVILLGSAAVGKTCLIKRFVDEIFYEYMPYQPSIGSMFHSRAVRRGSQTVLFNLWDTAGEEKFVSLTRLFYRGARVALVCYDMTDTLSFERIRFWVDGLKKVEEKCLIYICGTKKDKVTGVPDVNPGAVAHYVEEIGAKSIETSSKTGENVGKTVDLTSETPKKKKCC